METATTQDIRISVETIYQPMYSKPMKGEYVFAYRVTIENLGHHAVQLLRRHWHIWDSCSILREVEGEGVVGEQPIIAPGDSYQYVSGSPLTTDMGYMYGSFLMKNIHSQHEFEVDIPRFQLISPFKDN
jgi:ApaG protein